ncbi:hypothetical protein [Chryseobacterium pennipullorum]|uniref:DUF3592 domain-containing protein n=1 Tax=Chryseobacterium pennipullorum TaxID=2258963 RepID=A0A3D9AYV4_9FLAO|nr:hypothetical protein [Chryseobacterium pennipullorum]REC46157.1 hypothetical protein DRF67_15505 [Chryseobacterium pennipullorum]
MFGVNIKEYHSVYLTGITLLITLCLSYQWWKKEKRLKIIPKGLAIVAMGFIFYQTVIYLVTALVFLMHTAEDHLFSDTREAQVIDYKIQRTKPYKGSLFYPIVTYQDQDGQEKKAVADTGFGNDVVPKLKERVRITIDSENGQVRLMTEVKIMIIAGILVFILFGILILAGIAEYALTGRFQNTQGLMIGGSFYILIPLLILGTAFFFGRSAYHFYGQSDFSRSFWIHTVITGGCLLFLTGYINILRDHLGKRKKKKR